MKPDFVEKAKSLDVMYAVADKLFEWRIAAYLGDMSGTLAIWDFENLKCKSQDMSLQSCHFRFVNGNGI